MTIFHFFQQAQLIFSLWSTKIFWVFYFYFLNLGKLRFSILNVCNWLFFRNLMQVFNTYPFKTADLGPYHKQFSWYGMFFLLTSHGFLSLFFFNHSGLSLYGILSARPCLMTQSNAASKSLSVTLCFCSHFFSCLSSIIHPTSAWPACSLHLYEHLTHNEGSMNIYWKNK